MLSECRLSADAVKPTRQPAKSAPSHIKQPAGQQPNEPAPHRQPASDKEVSSISASRSAQHTSGVASQQASHAENEPYADDAELGVVLIAADSAFEWNRHMLLALQAAVKQRLQTYYHPDIEADQAALAALPAPMG